MEPKIIISERIGYTKEDTMDKVVVRSWEDLPVNIKYYGDNLDGGIKTSYGTISFDLGHGDLEKFVKILNALGGNFEYKPVEVIDTYEKWEEFQGRICTETDRLYYDRFYKKFRNDFGMFVKINIVEEKYNVDLKILKED